MTECASFEELPIHIKRRWMGVRIIDLKNGLINTSWTGSKYHALFLSWAPNRIKELQAMQLIDPEGEY